MQSNHSIAEIRREYMLTSLMESDVRGNPIDQFSVWWKEAIESEIDEVNAMTLATANAEGKPSARIVLLKGFVQEGFIFYTNYQSAKGQEMDQNSRVALLFFWKELERQVRIEGKVEKVSEADSDAYFSTRPAGSQIGAWASPQSSPIEGRHIIEENVKAFEKRFDHSEVPRPPHWGGYIVKPEKIEFWQGRSNRLHDRIVYTSINSEWKIQRLAP